MVELIHKNNKVLVAGEKGIFEISKNDDVAWKLMMLIEGECEPESRIKTAAKYGYCRQRYHQVHEDFSNGGVAAVAKQKPGPKENYRRTAEVERQIIRYRFLDPDASPDIIAQKLNQCGHPISKRSVSRVIEDYGLQKKTCKNVDLNPKTRPK